MSRPKSMTDFASLLNENKQNGYERPRKKPSISLAAGLIMASESPKTIPSTPSQGNSENLFYAYGRRSDYNPFPPYLLTFSSASTALEWWFLVKSEYPDSTRESPQLFTFKGDDILSQIYDNPKLAHLRNKWFYTHLDSAGGASAIIPLQDAQGNPVAPEQRPTSRSTTLPTINDSRDDTRGSLSTSISPSTDPPTNTAFDLASLNTALDRMNALITENSTQIRALSIAQSTGLQKMQEINESNAGQIKALADNQVKLQTLVSDNANQFIAMSNTSFQTQEATKGILQKNATQIRNLAEGQGQLVAVCEQMVRAVATVGGSIDGVAKRLEESKEWERKLSQSISPSPRKLNRKVKGIWYEYDSSPLNPSPLSSPRTSLSGASMAASVSTPPRSPVQRHVTFEK